MSDLTTTEQANVRIALRALRARFGTWDAVAAGLRAHESTLKLVRGKGAISASIAYRTARLAGVGVDAILNGEYPPAGVCRKCGYDPKEESE